MELEKCGDADHSIEMEAALKRFEDVCNSLDDEHTKLLALEKRRQQLNEDLERLRREITSEKKYFRSVIDEQITGESENSNENYENDQLLELAAPMTLDTGAIKEFIENQRDQLVASGKETNLICDGSDFKEYKLEEMIGKAGNDEMSSDSGCPKNVQIDLDEKRRPID